jgi:putative hydrolase of the HAD superfamily
MPIDVVLFDFGGVVVPTQGGEALAAYESQLGLDPGLLHPLMFDSDLWRSVSIGTTDTDGYWEAVGRGAQRDPALLREMLADVWEPPDIDEKVLEIIHALRPRVRVALLSNASLGLEAHLQRLGIADLFDPIINSARVGLRKPDPAVFQHALTVLDVPAQAVLFVDDKSRNTVVAEELGIPSVVFDNADNLARALSRHGLLSSSDGNHLVTNS